MSLFGQQLCYRIFEFQSIGNLIFLKNRQNEAFVFLIVRDRKQVNEHVVIENEKLNKSG